MTTGDRFIASPMERAKRHNVSSTSLDGLDSGRSEGHEFDGEDEMFSWSDESPYTRLLRTELLSEKDESIRPSRSYEALQGPRSRPNRGRSGEAVRVLEAAGLADDYYLDVLDWSAQDVIAVGLENRVYIQNTISGPAIEMCDIGEQVTSIQWSNGGSRLAVGSRSGMVSLWDLKTQRRIATQNCHHTSRVGCLSWHGHLLASGSRDRGIFVHDIRIRDTINQSFAATHRQEVCGLAWSPCGNFLASGGNDNKLNIWSTSSLFAHTASNKPLHRFSDHCAAVKAIAWSPHERGILASGAGTADRTIRLWNCHAARGNQRLATVDTGSQVCALAFAKSVNQLVSTHGYSLNQVCVWDIDSTSSSLRRLNKSTSLMGHSSRVLYLAMSPDGRSMLTGAGDNTLRLWKCFPALENRAAFGPTSFKRGFLSSSSLHALGTTTVR